MIFLFSANRLLEVVAKRERESDSRPKQERATPNECAIDDEKKKARIKFHESAS